MAGIRDGMAFRCRRGDSSLRLRKGVCYTLYDLRNELFQWKKQGSWKLCRVIPNARTIIKTNLLVPLDFCPKCYVDMRNHNANTCEKV